MPEPSATITIGNADDAANYDGEETVVVTVSAVASPSVPYRLCTLPRGTAVEAKLDNGWRLRSPLGVLFDLTFAGMVAEARDG